MEGNMHLCMYMFSSGHPIKSQDYEQTANMQSAHACAVQMLPIKSVCAHTGGLPLYIYIYIYKIHNIIIFCMTSTRTTNTCSPGLLLGCDRDKRQKMVESEKGQHTHKQKQTSNYQGVLCGNIPAKTRCSN